METSHQRHFQQKMAYRTRPIRPPSTDLFFKGEQPAAKTVYSVEYDVKPMSRSKPMRSGTASGDRRNNPHPPKTFIIWRFPSNPRSPQRCETVDALERELADRTKTTYHTEYRGIQQGVEPYVPTFLKKQLKPRSQSLNTFTRIAYQEPIIKPELQGNTSRYGCNLVKHVPAAGIVPMATSSKRKPQLSSWTSYKNDFGRTKSAARPADEQKGKDK
ncbi:uncharacterized protein [Oscarella lobularis]|uniref:uncharacterized protein n=1 Tax=Oscarella lobularis TaxID=121494 RepID=UPI003314298F